MRHLLTLVHGALVGVANVIPGVSGGTLALVLGIYERLLASIAAFGVRTVGPFLRLLTHPGQPGARRAARAELRRTDAGWLGLLALGALAAVLACSHLIAFLLDFHLGPTLAFFIGLILPSISVPYRLLERRGPREALAGLCGVAGILALSWIRPASPGEVVGWTGLVAAGVLAISAMILPGVSGSFILVLMGSYRTVIEAIRQLDLLRLGAFGLGCLVGLAIFVRLLNLLLRRFHSMTMAFLIGLILGSVWVLWPFKVVPEGAKIVQGTNVLPPALTPEVGWAAAALVAGLVCSAGIMRLGRIRSDTAEAAGVSREKGRS